MIYTIGRTKDYLQYFDEQGTPKKKGRTSDYVGGTVWLTFADAHKCCPNGYSVFGVIADWDKDAIENKSHNNSRDLLVDSDLVDLQ